MKNTPATDAIINRLRLLIELYRDDRLPPLAVLSKLLDVPQRALQKAAQKMRDRGELDFGAGKGICIVREEKPKVPVSLRSASRLYKSIKESITSGKYSAGEQLPKRDHFVLDHKVSSHTVAKALKMLATDNLIYRKGKSWIVGRPIEARMQSPRELPVILIVQDIAHTWQSYKNERTGKFVDRFCAESCRFGFRLQPFFVSSANPAVLQPFGTIEELNEFIGGLDHLYFGSIILGDPDDYPSFRGLVHSLTLKKRPVVWFDRNHRAPIPANISPFYYHFHFSESHLAATAIKHLADHGHSRICYIDIVQADWSINRGKLLQQFAKESEIECIHFFDLYNHHRAKSFDTFLLELRSRLPKSSVRLRKAVAFVASEYGHAAALDGVYSSAALVDIVRFFRNEPLMSNSEYQNLNGVREILTAFLDDRTTAFVFPRDTAARGYIRAFDHMSVRIPRDVSLLSFDNYIDSTLFPCNTIDIGAEELGYRAFHALSGIMPITRNCHDASIACIPRVVDRGSVSFPD